MTEPLTIVELHDLHEEERARSRTLALLAGVRAELAASEMVVAQLHRLIECEPVREVDRTGFSDGLL